MVNCLMFCDVISALSMILIFFSSFLVLAIITLLGSRQSYVLAKGWWFLLPAIVVVSVIRVYDFFIVYGFHSRGQFWYEFLYLVFGAFLFLSLLVQFLAIKQTIEGRKK
jgi:membrane protein YdbS with pleckstrin-like domain